MGIHRRDPLAHFRSLPLGERLFVRARLWTAPLNEVVRRAPPGRVADVGCGHGLVTDMLAEDRARQVIGVEPDPRKLAWAMRGPGVLPNVELRLGRVEDLSPELDGQLDAVTVVDVLYLIPTEEWRDFLSACFRVLRPGGVLLLKEAVDDGGWKARKCLAQEQVMVRLLRKTHSSGGLALRPPDDVRRILGESGFEVMEVLDLAAGYSTPHMLFVGRRPGLSRTPVSLHST